MIICTLQYVDKEHTRSKASRVSHHDIFTVNFPMTYGRGNFVREATLIRVSHIQMCRKITIILKLHIAEVHWWKRKHADVNI